MRKLIGRRMTGIAVLSLFAVVAVRFLVSPGALGETKSERMNQALAVQDAFVEVAETAAKAVVTIGAEDKVLVEDLFTRYFLGVQGLGSGVIFDKRGYVITNDHVIEILTDRRVIRTGDERIRVTVGKVASDIKVTLPDGRSFPAKVQGRDRLLDIAVLKMEGVEGQELPAAALGDSSKVRVGELVLAIGNPYGGYEYLDSPQPTVTNGIVSALERTFRSDDERRSYGRLIQTSAAINRGNSGGPLVNLNGEVIGINAAIFSTSQGSEGVGFAIPINRVQARLKTLIAGEKIEYGYLGVLPEQIDPRKPEVLSKRLGRDIPRGVIVAYVDPDSPADKAGLKEDDIIVKLGDKAIVNSAQLIDILANMAVGTKMPVTMVRDGKRIVKEVTVGGQYKPYWGWNGERED